MEDNVNCLRLYDVSVTHFITPSLHGCYHGHRFDEWSAYFTQNSPVCILLVAVIIRSKVAKAYP
jgi:hypothetical protein